LKGKKLSLFFSFLLWCGCGVGDCYKKRKNEEKYRRIQKGKQEKDKEEETEEDKKETR